MGKDRSRSISTGLIANDDIVAYELIVPDLVVADGIGWAPSIGSTVHLVVFDDHLELSRSMYEQQDVVEVPFSSLQDVEIDGGTNASGGGFFGGGFGAAGAIEGMAIATVLNKLTTKVTHWAAIHIVADGGSVVLVQNGGDVGDLRRRLRVLRDAIVVASDHAQNAIEAGQPDPTDTSDIVSSLERLANLHESGVLSDAEFQRAKAAILDQHGSPDK
jgi:hypothetical protein